MVRTLDGQRPRPVIMAPWGQRVAETIHAIWPQLSAEEQRAVVAAFGLEQSHDHS